MEQLIKDAIKASVQNFKLPTYEEIPDVGLYLEQTAQYVADRLAPLQSVSITPSMVSNYVKQGLIDSPVKKLYYRDHIAYLFFIAASKTVLSGRYSDSDPTAETDLRYQNRIQVF